MSNGASIGNAELKPVLPDDGPPADDDPDPKPSTRTSISLGAETLNAMASKASLEMKNITKAHKGHRNLLIRGTTTFLNAMLTLLLVVYKIDHMHKGPVLCAQLVSASSLFIQWRTGRPSMFLLRATCGWAIATINIHAVICGRTTIDEECNDSAWESELRVFRILSVCATVRLIFNGISLFLQFRYPHVMYGGHGNLQLWCRGWIQATGAVIGLVRMICQLSIYPGHAKEPEYFDVEVIHNILSNLVLVPIASLSLIHQWWMTSAGKTGNARADAWERFMNPTIKCPKIRVKVTIVSAKGLRDADLLGKSDPYCICTVPGRPESMWQTRHLNDTLDPVWNQGQELRTFRLNDSLTFQVFDSDINIKVPCCAANFDRDDFLGQVTLPGKQFETDGFTGTLKLEQAGKGHHATLTVQIDLLDMNGEPTTQRHEAVIKEDQDANFAETVVAHQIGFEQRIENVETQIESVANKVEHVVEDGAKEVLQEVLEAAGVVRGSFFGNSTEAAVDLSKIPADARNGTTIDLDKVQEYPQLPRLLTAEEWLSSSDPNLRSRISL